MDRVFNRALSTQPDRGMGLFMATGKALDAEEFARFMLGNAGAMEWAKVIMVMPKWSFIQAALWQLFRHD